MSDRDDDHMVVNIDRLMSVDDTSRQSLVMDEAEPLLQTAECRICQEEDRVMNLETPCACSGSLKVIHFSNPFIQFVFVVLLMILLR